MSCAKNQISSIPQASSEKKINYFGIETYNNLGLYQDAVGIINNDTIRFTLTEDYPLFYLFPTIRFSGKHIAPAETIAQNFLNPITYTVTAEDGTTKNYVVLGKSIFNHRSKDIIYFIFRTRDNPSIATDINGSVGNDSVLIKLTAGANRNHLVPFILINGISISPDNLIPQSFLQPVTYKVTAEDGSTKNYIVIISN